MKLQKEHRTKLLIELENNYLEISNHKLYMESLTDAEMYCFASIRLFLLEASQNLIKEIIANNEIDL